MFNVGARHDMGAQATFREDAAAAADLIIILYPNRRSVVAQKNHLKPTKSD